MKKIAVLLLLAVSLPAAKASTKVVYGQDNRKDLYSVRNPLHLQLAASTAGMVRMGQLSRAGQGLFDLQGAPTLERSHNVCASEKFASQPVAPACSGFLVGPDLLVTAGHCYISKDETPADRCKSNVWIFDYGYKNIMSNPTRNISINNVYLCKQVLHAERNNTMDYAIIRLDRPVVGRAPLKFRKSGKISNGTPLVVIGHPSALPQKVSDGGKVIRNIESTRFSTSLDTFHGNSGSAVFDARTGQVEGILIMGKNDYVPSNPKDPKSCMVVNTCDELARNCKGGVEGGPVLFGEIVLRIETIASKINSALSTSARR